MKDDVHRITVREMRELLQPPFQKAQWRIYPRGRQVYLEITEGYMEERYLAEGVNKINEWRNGKHVRTEIIKRLIAAEPMGEWEIPLQVTFETGETSENPYYPDI